MSSNLDRPLEEVIKEGRANRKAGGHRARRAGTKAVAAPVGGVKKSIKPAKQAAKPTPNGPANSTASYKIVVSGLPVDVTQIQIQEYFTQAAGPVRRVEMRYNQNGSSRGIADITFAKPQSAPKAAKFVNGMLVDGKPMKIEVVMNATAVPPAKSLSERVAYANPGKSGKPTPLTKTSANPKAQPKSAVSAKAKANATNKTEAAGGRRASRAKKGRTSNKPVKKTAEELDAEMTDYFAANTNGAPAVAAAAAVADGAAAPVEDLGMEEIS